jgi:hypothetical protein
MLKTVLMPPSTLAQQSVSDVTAGPPTATQVYCEQTSRMAVHSVI